MASLTLGQVYHLLKEKQLLKEIVSAKGWRHQLTAEEEKIAVTSLSTDSRQVDEGTLFICKGIHFSFDYLHQAVDGGVQWYVTDRLPEIDERATALVVTDSRRALAYLAFAFYGHPDRHLTILALGGTKGKTTTAYFLKNILDRMNGGKTGLLSTMSTTLDGKTYIKSHLTTPESLDLARMLATCVDNGLTHVVMEASSQAFKMERVTAMQFDLAAFLNISPDHIGENEHPDFEDYFYCKRQMFKLTDFSLVNAESDYAGFIEEELKAEGRNFAMVGQEASADYQWQMLPDQQGLATLRLKGPDMVEAETFSIRLLGHFNLQNAAMAATMALKAGASVENVKEGLLATQVPGRMEMVGRPHGLPILVDYAHNLLSLETVCSDLREHYPDAHLRLVIGAPGNRGISRRKDFGHVIQEYMDSAVLTADDPAFADVREIAQEIKDHCGQVKTTIIEDREEAIRYAIEQADDNTLVILAGKGRDNYQLVGDERLDYPGDLVLAQKIVEELTNKK